MSASKENLPIGYSLLSHEEYQVLTPEDKFPRHYHVGVDEPVLSPYPEDDSGEPSYWYDLKENCVKVSVQAGSGLNWMRCNMIKLVVDLASDPATALGKIVAVRPAEGDENQVTVSFADALHLAKMKAKEKREHVDENETAS